MTVDPRRSVEIDPPLQGERILLGLSGGPDSAGALVVLAEAARRFGFELSAFHVDHALRPDSRFDAEAARAQAEALGVPFGEADLRSTPLEGSLESAARAARYRALSEAAARAGVRRVVVAHTRDDRVETIALALFRGAGPRGLRGMRPLRPLRPGVDLWRPFLETSRADLRAAAIAAGLKTVDDPMNFDRAYKRVAIRLDLLPKLRVVAPDVDEALLRLGRLAAAIDDAAARRASELLVAATTYVEEGYVELSFDAFAAASRATRARFWLDRVDADSAFASFGAASILARMEDATRRAPFRAELARGLRFEATARRVALSAAVPMPATRIVAPAGGAVAKIDVGGGRSIEIERASTDALQRAAGRTRVDADPRLMIVAVREDAAIEIGPPQKGERFALETGAGTARVADVLSEKKVPALLRDRLPIVRVDGAVRWIPGVRRVGAAGPPGPAVLRLALVGPAPWLSDRDERRDASPT